MSTMDTKDFLAATEFSDFTVPEVKNVAQTFAEVANPQERAVRIFYFVRDSIKYSVGNWNKKASETLRLGHGTCTNSANLFVALARANGIPAGYGIMKVKGDTYFGPVVPPELSDNISSVSTHIYAYAYLNNTWVKCDPSDDSVLSESIQHLNPQSTKIEWDGTSDATLHLSPSDIIKDTGPIANIDSILRKRQKYWKALPIKIGNLYIDFLRVHGSHYDSVDALYRDFLIQLRKEHLFLYAAFKLLKPLFAPKRTIGHA